MINSLNLRKRIHFRITFILRFVFYTPKIIFRYINFTIRGKKVRIKSFKANSNYCIKGSLNQLTWIVENAVFITLENSSKVFFETDEEIFKVHENQKTFKIICYGVIRKESAITSIKIVDIIMADLEQISIKSKNQNMVVQKSSINNVFQLIHNKTPKTSLKLYKINDTKLNPKFKKVEYPLNELEKIQTCSSLRNLKRVKEAIT